MTQGIYAIEHIATSRRYIGSSLDVHKRFRAHVNALRRGVHTSAYLQHAWDKHTPVAFRLVVLEEVEHRSDLLGREQSWLNDAADLYNMNPHAACPPSRAGVRLTEAHRAKVSQAMKGRNCPWLNGKPRSAEVKAKIAAWQRGRKKPGSTRANMRVAQRSRRTEISDELKRQYAEGRPLAGCTLRAHLEHAQRSRDVDNDEP